MKAYESDVKRREEIKLDVRYLQLDVSALDKYVFLL